MSSLSLNLPYCLDLHFNTIIITITTKIITPSAAAMAMIAVCYTDFWFTPMLQKPFSRYMSAGHVSMHSN